MTHFLPIFLREGYRQNFREHNGFGMTPLVMSVLRHNSVLLFQRARNIIFVLDLLQI